MPSFEGKYPPVTLLKFPLWPPTAEPHHEARPEVPRGLLDWKPLPPVLVISALLGTLSNAKPANWNPSSDVLLPGSVI